MDWEHGILKRVDGLCAVYQIVGSYLSNRTLEQEINAYIAGDEQSGDAVCRYLEIHVRNEVRRFLQDRDIDHDDIVQDSLLAMLAYLRKSKHCPKRPEAFAVTITRNRCLNLYHWRKRRPSIEIEKISNSLAIEGADILDRLSAHELESLLESAFVKLDPECNKLLMSIYFQNIDMKELQRDANLNTVQGVYYRKYICLKKLRDLFNRNWFDGR